MYLIVLRKHTSYKALRFLLASWLVATHPDIPKCANLRTKLQVLVASKVCRAVRQEKKDETVLGSKKEGLVLESNGIFTTLKNLSSQALLTIN